MFDCCAGEKTRLIVYEIKNRNTPSWMSLRSRPVSSPLSWKKCSTWPAHPESICNRLWRCHTCGFIECGRWPAEITIVRGIQLHSSSTSSTSSWDEGRWGWSERFHWAGFCCWMGPALTTGGRWGGTKQEEHYPPRRNRKINTHLEKRKVEFIYRWTGGGVVAEKVPAVSRPFR